MAEFFPEREGQVNGRQSSLMALIAKKHFGPFVYNIQSTLYTMYFYDPTFDFCLIFLYLASSITFT